MTPGPFLEPTASLSLTPAPAHESGIKYHARVTEIGPMVQELLEAGILIFFGASAPPELREIAIVHTGDTLDGTIAPGDTIALGGTVYHVTGVGDLANKNLAELGHVVIKANGATVTELPGEISVQSTTLLIPGVGVPLIFRSLPSSPATNQSAANQPVPASPTQPALQTVSRRSPWAFLKNWLRSRQKTDRSV